MIGTKISRPTQRPMGAGLLPHHDIGPRERAPRLALVADLRGSELNGIFVLSRLAAFLRSIEAGERRSLGLRERVLIVPAINTLNRSARMENGTGRRRRVGTVVEAVVEITRTAYYRVDIHSASLDIEDLPQVSLYAPNDDERASACLFGLPAVIERPMEDDLASGLVRAWRPHGGESFMIHAGQGGSLQTGHCETLFRALVAFLDRTGIVGGLRLAEEEEDLRYFDLRQIFVVLAEQSGIFSSRLEVGRWIRAGEELGRVYDGFTGGVQARVTAPVTGLLASLRRQPLLCEGDLVARILMPNEAARRKPVRWVGERHERQAGRRL
ncbi:MAG: succinylglutamate desuccinylase [Candidatus Competibacteraceae bacterium]